MCDSHLHINNTVGLIDFLPDEVWHEHILTYFTSDLLLSTRLVNRYFSNIILLYYIKLKEKFSYSTFRLSRKKLKDSINFISRFENLKSFSFENPKPIITDTSDEQEIKLMNNLLSDLVNLEHLQEIDLIGCNHDGGVIEKLLERNNSKKLIENLTSLSVNHVKNEHFNFILENFINLKSLRVMAHYSFNDLMNIKLNDKLEELLILAGITINHLNQILKQGRNLKTLSIEISPIEIQDLTDLSELENLTSLTIKQDPTKLPYHSNYFNSLKNIRNLTELEIPWTIANADSDSVREFLQLAHLSFLKTFNLKILNNDEILVEIDNTLEKVIETISHLHNLTNLELDFFEIYRDSQGIGQKVLDNIPQLTKLETFKFIGNPDETRVNYLCDYYCVPTLKHLFIYYINEGIIPTRNDLKNIQSIEIIIEEENDVYYNLFSKTNLSNITSLTIGFITLKELDLISQMENLQELSMQLGSIASFENVKFPKLLQSLILESCKFLTGMEDQFIESIESCPFLEIIDFQNCRHLQDSFVEKLCKWIEKGFDFKQIMFYECDSLTNDSILHFKDLKNCKYVNFFGCRDIYFTMEISNILIHNNFIRVEIADGYIGHDNLIDTDSYIIHEEDIVNSLEKFENKIRNLLELRQFQKASLYLQANMFDNYSEESGNDKKLYQLLQDRSTLFETKWFFYYTFLKCHAEKYTFTKHIGEVEFIYNLVIDLVFKSQNDQKEELIEELKNLLVELFDTGKNFEKMMNTKSWEHVTKYLYGKRDFGKLLKCSTTTESQFELVSQITEQDCFQLASLDNLLDVNEDYLYGIIEKSLFFKNSPSFIEELADLDIFIDEIDSDNLELTQRVPERFKHSHLIELTVNMMEKNYIHNGESEIFDAFGYSWNVQLQEKGDWLSLHLKLLSCIPLNRRKCDSYENFNGNDGDSVELSFMFLNHDNNPRSYMSGRKIFNQSSMQHTFEIYSPLIEKYSTSTFKFVIGLDLISIKERITCPLSFSPFVLHNLSFDIPSDMKDYYLDQIILYSDPIVILGTKWTVKFVKKLESGIIELYLMLASLDLFNEKAVIKNCCVEFYFANKNLHPDSTIGFMERDFNDRQTILGGPMNLVKPEKNLNDGEIDRYEISFIMNIKSIYTNH